MERKNALITICGLTQGDSDKIEFVTDGWFAASGDGYLIGYEESELTGFEGVSSEIEIRENCVTLSRQGESYSQMMFENERRHLCNYNTPYGVMEMCIATSEIDNRICETGGRLRVRYTISMNNQLVSSNNLSISVRLTDKEKERTNVS